MIIITILNFSIVFAQENTVIRSYTYNASQRDSYESSKKAALDQLKLELLMEVCSFVFSKYESSMTYNEQEYKEKIDHTLISVTTGYIKVKTLDERWDGKEFWIKAIITYDENEIKTTVEKAIKDIELKDNIKEISVEKLQNIIEQQNIEIENIRQKAITEKRKKRLLEIISDQKEQIKKIKQIGGTRRSYSEQTAFLNITSTPSNVNVYLNGKWIGTTPIEKYEIEPYRYHSITLRGNLQYYLTKKVRMKFEKHEQVFKHYDLQKGEGKVLLISKYPIERIILNGKDVFFKKGKAFITMSTGKNIIEVVDRKGYVKYKFDIWHGEYIRKDINVNDYTVGGSRKLTDVYRYIAKGVKGNDIGYQYIMNNAARLSGYFVTFRHLKLGYLEGNVTVDCYTDENWEYIEAKGFSLGLSIRDGPKHGYFDLLVLEDDRWGVSFGIPFSVKHVGGLVGFNYVEGACMPFIGFTLGCFIAF